MPNYFLDFRVSKADYAEKRKGEYTKNTVFTDLEQKELEGLAAIESIRAIRGIFDVLAANGIDSDSSPLSLSEISEGIRTIAELGAAMTENAYANMCECLTGYAELMEERDDLSK